MFRSWCRNKLTPLSQCQQLQSVIIESANQNRDNPASHWYRNLFGNAYIAPDSFKQPDRAFVSAACKMQKQIGSEPKGKVSENPHKKKKSGSGPKQWWPLLENPKIPHQKSQFFCPHKTLFFCTRSSTWGSSQKGYFTVTVLILRCKSVFLRIF